MSAMDVYAAIGFALSMFLAYRLGVASERDRVREEEQLTADIAALRGCPNIDTHRRTS